MITLVLSNRLGFVEDMNERPFSNHSLSYNGLDVGVLRCGKSLAFAPGGGEFDSHLRHRESLLALSRGRIHQRNSGNRPQIAYR